MTVIFPTKGVRQVECIVVDGKTICYVAEEFYFPDVDVDCGKLYDCFNEQLCLKQPEHPLADRFETRLTKDPLLPSGKKGSLYLSHQTGKAEDCAAWLMESYLVAGATLEALHRKNVILESNNVMSFLMKFFCHKESIVCDEKVWADAGGIALDTADILYKRLNPPVPPSGIPVDRVMSAIEDALNDISHLSKD